LSYKNKKESVKYYKEYFDNINNLSILNFSNSTDNKNNIFKEKVKLSATNYGRKSGNRMLITLNAFNKTSYVPKRMRYRLLPVEINDGYLDKDSIIIHLPKSYSIEAMPKQAKINSIFGFYTSTITSLNDSTLIYKRTLKINQGLFPKEEYVNFRKFKKSVVRKDNSKLILIKKQQ